MPLRLVVAGRALVDLAGGEGALGAAAVAAGRAGAAGGWATRGAGATGAAAGAAAATSGSAGAARAGSGRGAGGVGVATGALFAGCRSCAGAVLGARSEPPRATNAMTTTTSSAAVMPIVILCRASPLQMEGISIGSSTGGAVLVRPRPGMIAVASVVPLRGGDGAGATTAAIGVDAAAGAGVSLLPSPGCVFDSVRVSGVAGGAGSTHSSSSRASSSITFSSGSKAMALLGIPP